MVRGESCTLSIETDLDLRGYAQVVLTLEDEGGKQLQIKGDRLTVWQDAVEAILTEEETVSLQSGVIQFQLRARNSETDAVVSNIMEDYLHQVLKEGKLDESM